MNQRRPEPGSPWARHCPDAWPREWLDERRELPPGFTRAADPHEADLIIGRTTEAAFLVTADRRTPTPRPDPKRKLSPVVRKLLGYREFFDALANLDPRLSPGAVALWCWLWTCEGKGEARCSVRKLAKRFRVHCSTASRWLAELGAAGFVLVVRRGRAGLSPSVVRVRASAAPVQR
jgi:hypothetical protein